MVFKIQAHHIGKRRQGIQAFFTACTKQHQSGALVELGIVKLRNRRWVHDVMLVHAHRIGIAGGDVTKAGDVFIQLDVDDAIVFQRMHGLGFGFRWLDKAQRLRNWHLVDHDLA